MAELIKLAKMAGVVNEADHAYSIRSTWWLHRLATDVTFIACVINWSCTFIYYLDLSNFISESELSYCRVLTTCLLLVYFVGAAGCPCFDFHFLAAMTTKKFSISIKFHIDLKHLCQTIFSLKTEAWSCATKNWGKFHNKIFNQILPRKMMSDFLLDSVLQYYVMWWRI